ncbi:MAG TPA: nucleotidyltransferase domain-containing protein [Anaerolineales bacterium]|nr:nucleotidyltransferase domain-containing protein [Anaerolineales bacterium]
MKPSLEAYRQSREVLLTSIITELSADERCIAAWLTGSYARNEADEVSDLDIRVIIAEPYSETLCARQEQVSHKTTPERLALFSKFGKPSLIHENNNNAPEGGTFTFVLYSDSALMVDWTLLPQKNAERPFQSLLLFDKANIPVSPPLKPEELEQSRKYVAQQWAFFWMMTAVTIKYIIRGDYVFVTTWLEELHHIMYELERRIQRLPFQYKRGSFSQFQPTREEQIESLRQLIAGMKALKPGIMEFAETELVVPLAEIEFLLALADENHARD